MGQYTSLDLDPIRQTLATAATMRLLPLAFFSLACKHPAPQAVIAKTVREVPPPLPVRMTPIDLPGLCQAIAPDGTVRTCGPVSGAANRATEQGPATWLLGRIPDGETFAIVTVRGLCSAATRARRPVRRGPEWCRRVGLHSWRRPEPGLGPADTRLRRPRRSLRVRRVRRPTLHSIRLRHG